jgi:hypothetical protein
MEQRGRSRFRGSRYPVGPPVPGRIYEPLRQVTSSSDEACQLALTGSDKHASEVRAETNRPGDEADIAISEPEGDVKTKAKKIRAKAEIATDKPTSEAITAAEEASIEGIAAVDDAGALSYMRSISPGGGSSGYEGGPENIEPGKVRKHKKRASAKTSGLIKKVIRDTMDVESDDSDREGDGGSRKDRYKDFKKSEDFESTASPSSSDYYFYVVENE